MTVELKTENETFLAVKVPSVQMQMQMYGRYLVLGIDNQDVLGKIKKIESGDTRGFIRFNYGNYKLIGACKDLTEEQWRDIIPVDRYRIFQRYTETGLLWLKANKVYLVNPHGADPCKYNNACFDSCQGSCWGHAGIDVDEWQEAEERTGNWVLIKKV